MFDLKEDIPNESILSVSSRILLINLEFGKLDRIKLKLDIIVILRNGELFHFGNLCIHVDLEVGTNSSQN
jgi:hypothetical protein